MGLGLGSSIQPPLPLAEKRGFLKEEGLEAEVIRISGSAASGALVSRDLDYHMALQVQAAIAGLPIRVVTCYVPATIITLMAQPQFKSVKELKGTTIAVNTFTGPPIFIARMIAKQFGLDPDRDLKFLASGLPEARLAALSQGLASRGHVACALGFPGNEDGFYQPCQSTRAIYVPLNVGLTTSLTKIKERRDEVKRVIKAGIKANRYIRTNRGGTIQFIQEWIKTDIEIATVIYQALSKVLQ